MASATPQAHEIHQQDIQAVIAGAAELRALHAALLPGGGMGSAAAPRPPVGTPLSLPRASHQLAAQDYPVFTPSYEEEPLPAYHYIHSNSQIPLETSDRTGLEIEERDGKEDLFDDKKDIIFSSISREDLLLSTAGSQKSYPSSCTNHGAHHRTSSAIDSDGHTRRTGSGDFKVVTACNKCKPAAISSVPNFEPQNHERAIRAVHARDTRQSSSQSHENNRAVLSWLFPRFKRKPKSGMSTKTVVPKDESQTVKEDPGACSLEALKKELTDANEIGNAALAEVGEMRSSLKELKQKLVHLEAHCEELKKALKQAMKGKDAQFVEKRNPTKRTKSMGSSREVFLPVSHEVMLEGFLQMASEARLSVKELCKTLISQSKETGAGLTEKLDVLIRQDNSMLNCRLPKGLQYHLESLMNRTLYQDFENCVFQVSGSQKILDPQQDCLQNFSAFVALRSVSWKEALRKGSRYYSEDLSKFCDQKMSSVASAIGWSMPWPEQLCQSFFVAAKCVWLLHLLAFSFSPPLAILRVEENRSFDPLYMEDILLDGQRAQAPAHVRIMIMPGFYLQDRVVRCKVLSS